MQHDLALCIAVWLLPKQIPADQLIQQDTSFWSGKTSEIALDNLTSEFDFFMIQPRLLEVPDLLKVPDSMPVSVPFEKDNMAAVSSSSLSLQISSTAPSSGPGSGPWLEEKEDVDITKYIEGLEDQVQVVPGSPPTTTSSSAPPCRGLKRSFSEGQFMTPSPPEEVKKKKK